MSEFEPELLETPAVVAQEPPVWLDPALYEMLAIVGLVLLAGLGMTLIFRSLVWTQPDATGEPAALSGKDYAGMGLSTRKGSLRKRK